MLTRDEIIQKAKTELNLLKTQHHDLFFVVKRKEKKVTAFIPNGEVLSKASSRCLPHETFNEFIGKIIAAKRLLDIKVEEEYLSVPQPEYPKYGDVLFFENVFYAYAPHGFTLRGELFNSYVRGRTFKISEEMKKTGKIVDDTGYLEEITWNDKSPEDAPTLDCYDRQKNTCDGRCQGMTDCPIVDYVKNDRESFPSKAEMLAFIKELKKENKKWRKFLRDNDDEIKKIFEK